MVGNFIEILLSNVNNDEALAKSISELMEANKAAYQAAVEQLENQQVLPSHASLPTLDDTNRLDQLLRHIS
jgi:hypothetical protein